VQERFTKGGDIENNFYYQFFSKKSIKIKICDSGSQGMAP
jgi:hypothetical protein